MLDFYAPSTNTCIAVPPERFTLSLNFLGPHCTLHVIDTTDGDSKVSNMLVMIHSYQEVQPLPLTAPRWNRAADIAAAAKAALTDPPPPPNFYIPHVHSMVII
jgi:hypothetical protein